MERISQHQYHRDIFLAALKMSGIDLRQYGPGHLMEGSFWISKSLLRSVAWRLYEGINALRQWSTDRYTITEQAVAQLLADVEALQATESENHACTLHEVRQLSDRLEILEKKLSTTRNQHKVSKD